MKYRLQRVSLEEQITNNLMQHKAAWVLVYGYMICSLYQECKYELFSFLKKKVCRYELNSTSILTIKCVGSDHTTFMNF